MYNITRPTTACSLRYRVIVAAEDFGGLPKLFKFQSFV
jgi:hypothetical protein